MYCWHVILKPSLAFCRVVSALLDRGDLVHAATAASLDAGSLSGQLMDVARRVAAQRWPNADALTEDEAEAVVAGSLGDAGRAREVPIAAAIAVVGGSGVEAGTGAETALDSQAVQEQGPAELSAPPTRAWSPAARTAALAQARALLPLAQEAERLLRPLCTPPAVGARENHIGSPTHAMSTDEQMAARILAMASDCVRASEALVHIIV